MDIDELKGALAVALDSALLTGDLLAEAVEAGDYAKALQIIPTYRAFLARVKSLRREIVAEVQG